MPAPAPACPVALPITAPRLAPAPVPIIAPFSVVVSDSVQPKKNVGKEMTKMVVTIFFISCCFKSDTRNLQYSSGPQFRAANFSPFHNSSIPILHHSESRPPRLDRLRQL